MRRYKVVALTTVLVSVPFRLDQKNKETAILANANLQNANLENNHSSPRGQRTTTPPNQHPTNTQPDMGR